MDVIHRYLLQPINSAHIEIELAILKLGEARQMPLNVSQAMNQKPVGKFHYEGIDNTSHVINMVHADTRRANEQHVAMLQEMLVLAHAAKLLTHRLGPAAWKPFISPKARMVRQLAPSIELHQR